MRPHIQFFLCAINFPSKAIVRLDRKYKSEPNRRVVIVMALRAACVRIRTAFTCFTLHSTITRAVYCSHNNSGNGDGRTDLVVTASSV